MSRGLRPIAAAAASVTLALGSAACSGGREALVVGSKNFTEQDILGELVADWVERTTDIPVRRRLHLGGTFLCHRALVSGDIDVYVEYTGTALTAILGRPPGGAPAEVRRAVEEDYAREFDAVWTRDLGFENTFAILVRGATADSLGLATISDAAPHADGWTPGFGYEFAERADGFSGLRDAYGLRFAGPPSVMDLGLTYRALAAGDVDLIAGNSTDGQIAALNLRMLADDRGYFPPYFAAPVVRRRALERFPVLRGALDALGGRIDTKEMRGLNRLVDVEGRSARDVARAWVDRELAAGG
ncbi:MAG: glycine betaine ABC transporter substrate-binding protein [Gemmatimonadota bacterium]